MTLLYHFFVQLIFCFLVFLASHEKLYSFEEVEELENTLIKDKFSESSYKTPRGRRLSFPNTYKILFAGDVMMVWGVKDSIQSYGPEIVLQDWEDTFKSVDRRLVNFESTIYNPSNKPMLGKAFVFASGEKETQFFAELLRIDGFLLGNNHAMDYGWEGLDTTINFFKKIGVPAIGVGRNEEESYIPIRWNENNTQVVIFSVNDIRERNYSFAVGKKPGVASLNETILKRLVKKEPPNSNLILSVHWGLEYSWEPTISQRKLAKRLIESGFNAIVGHHPHIPQGIEIIGNKPVIYSLGNFVFGSKNYYLNHNILVILHFLNNQLVTVEIIPAFGKFKNFDHIFFPLAPKEAEEFLEEYSILCKKLGTNLHIQGGRGYIFLDKKSFSKE